MVSVRVPLALKVALGVLPVCYSGLVIAHLPSTITWVVLVAVVLMSLLFVIGSLQLPLQTIWPVFPGALLLLAGALALLLDAPTLGLPNTSLSNLLILGLIAGCYLVWAERATWKVSHLY